MFSIPDPWPTGPGTRPTTSGTRPVSPDPRLALIGSAIDELAEQARAGEAVAGTDGMAQRLACVWAMVADLDPALAQRLPRYTATD